MSRRLMRGRIGAVAMGAAGLVAALVMTGCSGGIYSVPLPGGAGAISAGP